jgi:hypothetical protein
MGTVKGKPWHARRRTALIVLAPIVSVATLMLGLRVGAGNAVRSASVFAAPPGKPASAGGPTPFAWQILTYLEDRSVRETIAMNDIVLIARSKGKEARWEGASNADGVAEAVFELPSFADGDPVDVEVRTKTDAMPLAAGVASWKTTKWPAAPDDIGERAAARPSRREGAIGIDLLVEGERLVVGFETPMWAHAVAPSLDPSRIAWSVTPEPGLSADLATGATSKCDGWVELPSQANAHVVGIQIEAKIASPTEDARKGVWFGALPVAPGAFFVGAPRFVPEGKAEDVVLVAPNPRNVVYAEVDDEHGRVFAVVLPVTASPSDPVPRARFTMPKLAPGLHWIVASGEPHGAERLAGAAIAKPFLVGGAPGVRPEEACSIGPWLARRPATGFARWLAVDGMAVRGASNRAYHRLGLFIGLVSLLAAAILEVLLLTAASREARAVMLLADLDEPEADRDQVTARPPGGNLAIALLVAMLGFALLAALMIAKG